MSSPFYVYMVGLGLLLGTPRESLRSITVVTVSPTDGTCSRLEFDEDGILTDQITLPREGHIGLDDLVALHGYVEAKKDERKEKQDFLFKHREIGESIFKSITQNGWQGKRAIAALHRSVHFDPDENFGETNATPFSIDLGRLSNARSKKALNAVVKSLKGLSGLKIEIGRDGSPISIEIKDELARRFVGGTWMEAIVLGRVCRIFSDGKGAEVAAGIELAVDGANSASRSDPPVEFEIDVAIAVNDQLHAIEIKAVTGSRGFGDFGPKLVKIKEEIGSQRMNTFLVAPLLNEEDIRPQDWATRARKQGIRMFFGPNALNCLGGVLRKLNEERSRS